MDLLWPSLIVVGAVLLLLAVSVRYVPADPPHFAVLTLFGQRTRWVKREGYRLFPLYPFVVDAILVDASNRNLEVSPRNIRTSDKVELEIDVNVTWAPNAAFGIEYLNQGGRSEVEKALTQSVTEALREWAISRSTWEDAVAVCGDATALLIQHLIGSPIESGPVSTAELANRRSRGEAIATIPSLGITIHRLTVGSLRTSGRLAAATELAAVSAYERAGERVQLAHVMEIAKEVRDKLGCSTEDALEVVQTERGKVQKVIQQVKGTISSETLASVLKILDRR